jgi:hypothetical protein
MGYTHYWTYNPDKIEDTEELREKFLEASRQIRRCYLWIRNQRKDIKIRGGLGAGKPVFNETEIWFNGNDKEGLSHETFSIHWFNRGGSGRDFCKTARKPYDFLVSFALLTFASFFSPEVFSFSSDGDEEDWSEARQFYREFTGFEARNMV